MTYADVITALLILGFFFAGFSQAFLPVYNAWNDAEREYQTAGSIQFVAQSFQNECAKSGGNLDNWKKAVKTVKELEKYEITELRQDDIIRAYRLSCIISGQTLEVIGLYAP